MLLKMVIGTKGFKFLSFYPILLSVRPRKWSFWSRSWSKVARLVDVHISRVGTARARAIRQFALFTSFLMACPIPIIPIAVVLDMMKNKTYKSWKYLNTREGYFGHLVTIFVMFL